MKNFKNLSNLVKSSLDSTITAFNEMLQDDKYFDNLKSQIDKLAEKSQEKLNEIMKTSKTEMTVFIPYDRDLDVLSTSLKDNVFTAIAKREDGTSERNTQVYIPTEYDTTTMSQKYDETNKNMVFSFKRK